MSVEEQSEQSEAAAPKPLAAAQLQMPLTLIADGASCTLDGHCTPS